MKNSAVLWFFLVGIFLIIIFIFLGIFFIIRSTDDASYRNILSENIIWPSNWSLARPSDNSPENTCLYYQFTASTINGITIPANPNLQNDQLAAITPVAVDSDTCYDPDAIIAQQMEHTCNPSNSKLPSLCYTSDGVLVDPGQSEIYYSACNNPPCSGTLGLIALDFSPSTGRCIYGNEDGYQLTILGGCDLADNSQLFRWEFTSQRRWSPFNIFDRTRNLYLVPSQASVGSIIVGSENSDSSTVWLYLPPFSYLSDLAPAQILYVGNVDLDTFPINELNVNNNNALSNWILDNQILSLTINNNNQLILDFYDFGSPPTPSDPYQAIYDSLHSANLIPYTLFNTVYNRKICVFNNGRSTGIVEQLPSQVFCLSV